MTPRVEELFHLVADLPPGARARYFADHGVDEQTRREVEALLAFDSHDTSALTLDIGAAASRALSLLDAQGARCGSFRLMKVIGRGGMGVVYLAERDDGEVAQRAAVKLLRPGLADHQHERFLQERRILASLTHPNIAGLLDAGRLDDGQPYLAMEYVEGQPIDDFTASLPIPAKIRLFLKVCAAVAYMHSHLVIHRDLKPGNILVTAGGEPKLLDFGIAKIVDLATDATMTGLRMLTPDYASPEQVLGEPIGTASDIYSLGAVLYEILTGHPPHAFEDLSPGAVAAAITRQAVTRPSAGAPELKGDLDAILMKALRREPQERYATVDQMAEDLEAFLESRPVRARKGDFLYRARKFARRYWLPVAAASLALAGLSVGLWVANRERAIAQRRFDDVRQLSSKLFDIDRQVRELPGGAKTRQLIVDTSLEYLRRLAADARTDPELALDVGGAYMRVGRVQGVPISTNLGQTDNAEANLQIAEKLIRSVVAVQPGNRTALLRMAQITHDRMVLAEGRRPDTAALPLARESHQWLDKYLAGGPIGPDEKEQPVIAGMNVANWYIKKDLVPEGVELLRRVIQLAKTTGQPHQAGAAQIVVSRALRQTGDLNGSLAAIVEGVKLLEPLPGNNSISRLNTYGLALVTQGEVLGEDESISFGRYDEAAGLFQRDLEIGLRRAQGDPNDTVGRFTVAGSGTRLAGVLRHSDPRQALAVYDQVLHYSAEIKNNSRARRGEVTALAGSTYPLRKLGRDGEARRRLDTAFARLQELGLYPAKEVELGSEPFDVLRALADLEAGIGSLGRAIEIYRQLLDRVEASSPRPESVLWDANDITLLYAPLARLHRAAGHAGTASDFEQRLLSLWRGWDRKLPGNPYVRRQLAALPQPR
ncbi:MAG: serine/threonine-protein kinase [Bryobacteraceae bacterium]